MLIQSHRVKPGHAVAFPEGGSIVVDRIEQCSDLANVHWFGKSRNVCVPRVSVVNVADESAVTGSKPRKRLSVGHGKSRA